MKRRFLASLLTLTLVLSLLPAQALAAEEQDAGLSTAPEEQAVPEETVEKSETDEQGGNVGAATLLGEQDLSGACGETVTWKLTQNNSGIDGGESPTYTLEILGEGAMKNYESERERPWHNYIKSITQLSLSDQISSISDYAFFGTQLTGTIRLSANMQSVGAAAFPDGVTGIEVDAANSWLQVYDGILYTENHGTLLFCPRPKTGTFTSEMFLGVTEIGAFAFSGCKNLTGSLQLSDSVKKIGAAAFNGCTGISGALAIGDSVIEIGKSAFYNCTGINGPISIGNSVKTIGDTAFHYCINATGLVLGTSVEEIGASAFIYDSKMAGDLRIPDSLKSIGDKAFQNCGFDGILTLGSGIQSIGSSAFQGLKCSGEFSFTENLTTIGAHAFYNCENMTGEIRIPDSVTSLGQYAFANCKKVSGCISIGNRITAIPNMTFNSCGSEIGSSESLHLQLGNAVTSIGNNAFESCAISGLLIIPETVTSVGSNAFHTTKLDQIAILNGNMTIGNGAFVGSSATAIYVVNTDAATQLSGKYSAWKAGLCITNGGVFALDTEYQADTLLAPTRGEKYSFENWYANSDFSGGSITTPGVPAGSASATYYAKWNSTITFDPNDGTGFMAAQTIGETDTTTPLSRNEFTRDGYEFAGWNTKADGTGVSYDDGATGAGKDGHCTLYAQWTKHIGTTGNYTVDAILDHTYTGAEICPDVVVKDGESVLTEGYTVTYESNTNVGEAKVTVTIGDASAEVTFQITRDENPAITMAPVEAAYGEGYTMSATARTSAGNEITDGVLTITYYTDEACTQGGITTPPTAVGTYYAKAVLAETANYAGASAVAKLTIRKAELPVTAAGYSGVYDGQPHAIQVTAGEGVSVTYSTDGTTYGAENPAFTAAGTYTVYYKAEKVNYEDVTGSLTVAISPAPLTAVYGGESIRYGEKPALKVTVTGFVNGETAETAAGYQAPTVTADVTTVGEYTLTPAGGAAKNYSFLYQSGLLKITSAAYPVLISADRKTMLGSGTVTLTVTAAQGIQVTGVSCDDPSISVTANGDGTYAALLPNITRTYTFTVDVSGDMGNYEGGPAACTVSVTGFYAPASSGSTVTGTVTNPDGSTTTTVTDKKTGTVTETTKFKDGSTLVVETKRDGTVTTTEQRTGGVTVETVARPGENVTAKVTLPGAVGTAVVTIPADVDYGTVAVDAVSGKTVKLCFPTRDGMTVRLDGSARLVLVDRSRGFTDTRGHWAEDAIDFATAHELFAGTSGTAFSPNSPMTRAMLMTVLARFDGQDTTGGTVWYEKAMAWAKENGISDGTDPNGSITREQLAVMLWRYAGSPAVSNAAASQFTDSGKISSYAVEALDWAVSTGLFGGMGDGTLAPQGSATRAQVATILMRFVEHLTR